MTTLVLVRHAKSDWSHPELSDHDRPLGKRGLRDAPVMAAQLAATGAAPDAILSSTALRARTTAEYFGSAFGLEVQLREELYGAWPDDLLTAAESSDVDSVLIVAHDPGMTMLAEELSDGGIEHMPTCAVAQFEWDELDWGLALSRKPRTWRFDRPRPARSAT